MVPLRSSKSPPASSPTPSAGELRSAVLCLGTIAYLLVAQLGGGLAWFVAASLALGLGFTFYSGAVEAWTVAPLAHLPAAVSLQAWSRSFDEELRDRLTGLDGLALTGHFLERFVFSPENREVPAARARLVDGIGKATTISSNSNAS